MTDAIDVGRLRAHICAFAARIEEPLGRAVADNVTGIDGRPPYTDFAEAFRRVLDAAQLRLSRNSDGDFVAHDLRYEESSR